jgi:Flp pilus assembly protein TadG
MPYRQLLVPRWLTPRCGWRHFGSEGSVAVELGLTAPILVILAVSLVDLGNFFNFSQALEAATRIGAEYARAGLNCQQSWGSATVESFASSGCQVAVQNAITSSMAFVPALNPPTVSLSCDCASTANPATYQPTPCGTSCFTSPPAGGYTGPNRVFVTVGATQPFSAMISWPKMPTTLAAVTTIRVQ